MSLQTFLDIASHGSVSTGEIVSLGVRERRTEGGLVYLALNPKVRVVGGPVCKEWCLEIKAPKNGHRFLRKPFPYENLSPTEGNVLVVYGDNPLFPGLASRVSETNIDIEIRQDQILADD
jgi:hypothetical protein